VVTVRMRARATVPARRTVANNIRHGQGDGPLPVRCFMSSDTLPFLGYGLGLRPTHYPHIFAEQPAIDWFEIISENFMDTGGKPRRNLDRIRERYPVVMHGVSLSIGTVDPLNSEYLQKLKALKDHLQPAWISDHLCWTGVAHRNTHDLLPVPYTEAALRHIVSRLRAVQDILGCPIALENPSTYLEFTSSQMPEAEFIARMAEDSGCQLLLDVNNVYVTCFNHRLDPKAYLDTLPLERVIQIHLSGHTNKGTHIIDTHDDHVVEEVWQLYRYVLARAGRVPNTMIEWDDRIPDFPTLAAELEKAKQVADAARSQIAGPAWVCQPAARGGSPISLPQALQHMQEAIMHPEDAVAQSLDWIHAKPGFACEAQLQVYRHAYRARLHDVVAEDYPVLKTWLGTQAFDALLHGLIDAVPPTHFNIARYAQNLAEFLSAQRPEDGFAHALCELETAIAQLADAAETAVLVPYHLEGMTPERLMESRLPLRTALSLHRFRYPVNAYYGAVMDDLPPAVPELCDTYLAVFRHEDVMWRMDLDAAEYALLTRLWAGQTVAEALDGMDASAEASLAEWFARWMRNGLLAAPANFEKSRSDHAIAQPAYSLA